LHVEIRSHGRSCLLDKPERGNLGYFFHKRNLTTRKRTQMNKGAAREPNFFRGRQKQAKKRKAQGGVYEETTNKERLLAGEKEHVPRGKRDVKNELTQGTLKEPNKAYSSTFKNLSRSDKRKNRIDAGQRKEKGVLAGGVRTHVTQAEGEPAIPEEKGTSTHRAQDRK